MRKINFAPRYLPRTAQAIAVAAAILAATIAPPASANKDSIAVIIGNRDYSRANTFNVEYAHNDAEAMRTFAMERLGVAKGNIIFLKDATLGQMRQVFGSEKSPRGQLWNWARPGRSNVFVYYSGHGAPDMRTLDAYLIPTDVDPQRAAGGYPLYLLDRNLTALKERLGPNLDVVLMLDACFSGRTGGGALGGYSGGLIPNITAAGKGVIRIAASRATEVANWDRKRQLGLFTSVFLEAAKGKADVKPLGDGNGEVSWVELAKYVDDEVSYRARRLFGRDQTPELQTNHGPGWRFEVGEKAGELTIRVCRKEPARWQALQAQGDLAAIEQAASSFKCPHVRQQIDRWIAQKSKERREVERLNRERERLARQKAELEALQEKARLEREALAQREAQRRQQMAAMTTPRFKPEPDNSPRCGWYAISYCSRDYGPAAQAARRYGGAVINTSSRSYPNFRSGWYCSAVGPLSKSEARRQRNRARNRGASTPYIKNAC